MTHRVMWAGINHTHQPNPLPYALPLVETIEKVLNEPIVATGMRGRDGLTGRFKGSRDDTRRSTSAFGIRKLVWCFVFYTCI